MNKQRFHIDIESLLWLPGQFGVFWKDCEGRYLGCNDVAAEKARLTSRHDVVDRTDFDIDTLLKDEAVQIREGDQQVLSEKKSLYFLHSATGANSENFFLTVKAPLYNQEHQLVGVYGTDTFINIYDQDSYLPLLLKLGISVNKISSIKDRIKNNFKKSNAENLTHRQLDCLYYLVRGMTIKEIAATLELSSKTVEHYLQTIKEKLHCYKKSQLITKALCIPYIRNKLNI
jgi:DNA-binding CsgD family transcriptional regulator